MTLTDAWTCKFCGGAIPKIGAVGLTLFYDDNSTAHESCAKSRALPLPEGDGLSREKILGMWSELESGRALPLAEDLRAVFSLALRAMPLPEGETAELVLANELRRLADQTDGRVGEHYLLVMRQAAAALSRQAASLATANRAADAEMERVKACEHIACGDEGWEVLRNECPSTAAVAGLRDAFEAAEASLASARRLNRYARHYESCPARTEPTATCDCGFEAACDVLSSPRQEATDG